MGSKRYCCTGPYKAGLLSELKDIDMAEDALPLDKLESGLFGVNKITGSVSFHRSFEISLF